MRKFQLIAGMAALFASMAANAWGFSGTVTWIELWRNGNVAFRLSDAASATTCSGTFILDAADPGTQNRYAALLASKKTGSPIAVNSTVCGGGGNYIIVDYLYIIAD